MTKQTQVRSIEEALKLALEALTHFEKAGLATLKTVDAITAIREALAEHPAQTDWEAVAADQAMTIALLRAEQPAQQEPGRNHWEDGDVFERIAAMKTQPAQRTWVGLTDEEMDQWIEEEHDVLRWAEAKLKEKNSD